MKPKQLSLFDEPTKVRERKAGSQAATPDPKPDTKGPEPLDEEAPLVDLAVDLAGERMRKPVNLRTLDRWVEKYGEAGVRDAAGEPSLHEVRAGMGAGRPAFPIALGMEALRTI